jgi:hypothetical protein
MVCMCVFLCMERPQKIRVDLKKSDDTLELIYCKKVSDS